MDWLAGSRMHFVEIILLRSITSLPLFTLGFAPSVMQAYIGFVYVWSSLLHANVGGNFNRHTAGVAQAMLALRKRSEEHTSELQSLMRISYAVFCLKKQREQQE